MPNEQLTTYKTSTDFFGDREVVVVDDTSGRQKVVKPRHTLSRRGAIKAIAAAAGSLVAAGFLDACTQGENQTQKELSMFTSGIYPHEWTNQEKFDVMGRVVQRQMSSEFGIDQKIDVAEFSDFIDPLSKYYQSFGYEKDFSQGIAGIAAPLISSIVLPGTATVCINTQSDFLKNLRGQEKQASKESALREISKRSKDFDFFHPHTGLQGMVFAPTYHQALAFEILTQSVNTNINHNGDIKAGHMPVVKDEEIFDFSPESYYGLSITGILSNGNRFMLSGFHHGLRSLIASEIAGKIGLPIDKRQVPLSTLFIESIKDGLGIPLAQMVGFLRGSRPDFLIETISEKLRELTDWDQVTIEARAYELWLLPTLADKGWMNLESIEKLFRNIMPSSAKIPSLKDYIEPTPIPHNIPDDPESIGRRQNGSNAPVEVEFLQHELETNFKNLKAV